MCVCAGAANLLIVSLVPNLVERSDSSGFRRFSRVQRVEHALRLCAGDFSGEIVDAELLKLCDTAESPQKFLRCA